jgi:hypothetical protein
MRALVGLYLGIVRPTVGFFCPAHARQSCTIGAKSGGAGRQRFATFGRCSINGQ